MINCLQNLDVESLKDYPYCIVGSGAAGISLTIALARMGKRVILLESGDWQEDKTLADAYVGQATEPHPATAEYRRQRFGGTTHLWGGRCVPFDEIDFDLRAHVPNSGWPMQYSELAAYYPEAMQYCDAGMANFSVNALSDSVPMFDDLPALEAVLAERIERYSLPTDFSKKYRHELEQSRLVQVVLKARVTKLNVDGQGGRVESVQIWDGINRVTLKANHYVLCAGGIETARLLLATRDELPAWSRFDHSLGKYYSCHYDLIFGALSIKGNKPAFNFQKTKDGVYARRKMQFLPAFQLEHKLLNSAFRLHFPAYADATHGSGVLSTIYLAKSILAAEHQSILNHGASKVASQSSRLSHLKNVMSDMGSVFSFGYDWLFRMKLAKRRLPYTLVPNRNGSYPLEFNSEQVPDAINRIELSSDRDTAGMKRVSVHWKMTRTDIDSGVESFTKLQHLLSTTPHCALNFDRAELREKVTDALPVGGHHIGTTRMGLSDKTSVVDENCQMHGVQNLYIASASTFPTSSHANPTLTIVALALRLANFLNARS